MELVEKIQEKFPKYKQKMVLLMCEKMTDNGILLLYDTLNILKHFHQCDKFTANYNDKTNKYEIVIKDKLKNKNFQRYMNDVEKKYTDELKIFTFLYEVEE